jgi:TRAP-type C4-dicarboxylate transport system substrate-binding protein
MLAAAIAARAAEPGRPLDIKLATILPRGTSGFNQLQELRDEWSKTSGQTVALKPVSAAHEGERQIVTHLAAGNYQAALLSIVGLAEIDRSVTCLQLIPMQFRDWAEVDHVREKIRGELERRLRAKGYEVLFWADAGWVRYFSKNPAVRPADFQPMKMFVWAGEPQQMTILRSLGYRPVSLETDSIPTSLASGMITALPVPPFLANALQYTKWVHHMVDLNWVPIVGAAVVRRDAWERVAPSLRPGLLAAAATTGEKIRARGRAEDEQAIVAMQKRGLTVHRVTPAVAAEWQALATRVYPQIRGQTVPADLFDRVQAEVAAYRAASTKTTQ